MGFAYTRPKPGAYQYPGKTGVERAAARLKAHIAASTPLQPTRETRQNFRNTRMKAAKQIAASAEGRKAGLRGRGDWRKVTFQ
jgi:hypothetical protein